MKKAVFFLFLICFLPTIFATQSIINYQIPTTVRLNENLTVHGYFIDTGADVNNTLCKFDIFDANGKLVKRLTDEYIYVDGSFSTETIISEPTFFRGDDYNIQTTCQYVQASRIFLVEQPLSITHLTQKTEEYIFSEGNLTPLFFVVSFVAIILSVGLVGGFLYKRYREMV